MEINRNHLENADEAWIAKYRTALSNAPVPQPRFMRVRAALASVHKSVSSQLDRIFSARTKTQPSQRPVPVPEPVPVAEPEKSIRKVNRVESSVKRASKQATTTTKRSRPIRSAKAG